ncbi:hypothetical protein ACWCPM_10405 [Streptomyces sp. NPDC002309]
MPTAQGVLLVRNNVTVNITIDSARIWWTDANGTGVVGSSVECNRTVVVSGELTACYGKTIHPGTDYWVHANYWHNGMLNGAVPEKI